VAQADERSAGLLVDELRQSCRRRAEDLSPPLELLEPRQRDEALEGILREELRRRARRVVGKGVPVAEWAAGEDARHATAVEGGEQGLDVARSAELARPGVLVRRDDLVAERSERGELVGGEESTASRASRLQAGKRCRQRGKHGAQRAQELA